jgi:hypothetical protein
MLSITVAVHAQTILRVRAGAPPGGDGSSWAAPYNDLQAGLAAAQAAAEIWVASGTYRPIAGTDRTATFALRDNIRIYGGFAGVETSRDQRDPAANPTILSGEIGSSTDPLDNSYHVVTAGGVDASAVLDGFWIRSGAAIGAAPDHQGGGIVVTDAAPIIRACLITANIAGARYGSTASTVGGGGGAAIRGASFPHFDHCYFLANTGRSPVFGLGYPATGGFAGAALVSDTAALFTDCSFVSNTAGPGGSGFYGGGGGSPGYPGGDAGAIYVEYGRVELRRCSFEANYAGGGGGGGSGRGFGADGGPGGRGGAIFLLASEGSLEGCSFVHNHAGAGGGAGFGGEGSGVGGAGGSGGAIHCTTSPSLTITNCVFGGNEAGAGGSGATSVIGPGTAGGPAGSAGALYVPSSAPTAITGSIIIGNRAGSAGPGGSGSPGYPDGPDGAAGEGGALGGTLGHTSVTNCTLYANSSPGHFGGISGSPAVVNSIFWANSDSTGSGQAAQIGTTVTNVRYCCVQSLSPSFPGPGNTAADPLFMDPLGPDGLPGTSDDDLRLRPNSPCIDAADNTALPSGTVTDLAGFPRFHDDPGVADRGVPGGDGGAAIADMGAYEFQGASCRVDLNGDGQATVADALAFFQFFAAADPRADFDADAHINLADFLAFLTAYAHGCS